MWVVVLMTENLDYGVDSVYEWTEVEAVHGPYESEDAAKQSYHQLYNRREHHHSSGWFEMKGGT